jgi:hypothetical protein
MTLHPNIARVLLLTLCSAAQGCGGNAPPPDTQQQPSAQTPADGAGAEWQECIHGQGGFSVAFPVGWQTNDGSVMPPCVLFDPAAIEVPYASELPADIAVGIHLEEVDYNRIAGETFGIRLLSSEEVVVAGRPGLRRLVEQTGEGLLDAGLRSWQYIADWGDGRTLLAVSHDVGEPAFEVKRRVLDEMMARLQPAVPAPR